MKHNNVLGLIGNLSAKQAGFNGFTIRFTDMITDGSFAIRRGPFNKLNKKHVPTWLLLVSTETPNSPSEAVNFDSLITKSLNEHREVQMNEQLMSFYMQLPIVKFESTDGELEVPVNALFVKLLTELFPNHVWLAYSVNAPLLLLNKQSNEIVALVMPVALKTAITGFIEPNAN